MGYPKIKPIPIPDTDTQNSYRYQKLYRYRYLNIYVKSYRYPYRYQHFSIKPIPIPMFDKKKFLFSGDKNFVCQKKILPRKKNLRKAFSLKKKICQENFFAK